MCFGKKQHNVICVLKALAVLEVAVFFTKERARRAFPSSPNAKLS